MDYIKDKLNTAMSSYDATEPQLDLVELWNQFMSLPDVASAQYIPSSNASTPANIAVYTSQRDVHTEAKRDAVTHYMYDKSSQMYTSAPAVQQDGVVTTVHSPSGNKTLIIRTNSKHSDEKTKTAAYWLDVYDKTGRLLFSTTTKNIHGKILPAGTLGGIHWHPSEQCIVYMAECKPSKLYGLFDDSAEADHKVKGLQYEWREEHGEQYGGIVLPRPYILSLGYPYTIYPVDGIPNDVTVAQCTFAPTDDVTALDGGIIVTGWQHAPRKLGLTHYNTRPSKLYYVPFNLTANMAETRNTLITRKASKSASATTAADKDANTSGATSHKNDMIMLTPNDHSAMCAKVSPDQQHIVYVTTRDTYAHHAASYVKSMEWSMLKSSLGKRTVPDAQSQTVIDIVDVPASPDSFQGVYTGTGLLPTNVWLGDSRHVVLATAWRSVNVLIVADTVTGKLTRVSPPGLSAQASVSLADVRGNSVLIHLSTPTQPTAVYTGQVAYSATEGISFAWTLVHHPVAFLNEHVQKQVSALKYSIIQHTTSTLSELPFESILLLPPARHDGRKPGCVVFPHGGPHGAYSTSWIGMSAYFALCGLAVLHINFRGSTGFGEKFLESLPSRIGALDVMDCVDAAQDVAKQGLIDEDNLVAFGGSHGGFLGLHLVGQHPDMFKACVVRNPVCNVAAMTGLSDIPDWCLYEAGLAYNARSPPSIQEQQQMYAASPIAHVNKVKTPTYLMLGTADRRVPPQQALDYGRYLKANNVKHRIAIYPDCQHALDDKVEISYNMGVDCALWLLQRFYTPDDVDSNASMDLSIPR